ncbi:FecR domain-containing protein [Paraburkholderia unamae]|uniref:FecR family protein n=1 Tax=Paraburkholderia unamae TaxID=219649 RepID=A0ABX5KH29_9BURK|nr:FecR domain-containing protein [Paraburkholderia unamae]PVX76943.1 FecR family protein [Paraburkholderia unamae]CAG9260139.1 FecR family protein [Paraburkholderia unamae]
MNFVPPNVAPEVAHRAVEWWLDLSSGSVTPTQRAAFEAWRAAHADHERAWQHIQDVSGRFQSIGDSASANAARSALTRSGRGVSRSRRAGIKAFALLLFAGGATWSTRHRSAWPGWASDLHTATGEVRTVTLADDTTLTLDTATAVDVRFTQDERRIVLRRGAIMVATGHRDGLAPRPFVVQTAQGTATPIGTRFSVRQAQDDTRIAVFEGAVCVVPGAAPSATQTLRAGERAQFTENAVLEKAPVSNDASAWTKGMLVANNMRLADLLDELSRYREGLLRCDPRVASLRVSGTYLLADTDLVLETLTRALPLRVDYLTRFWVTVGPART